MKPTLFVFSTIAALAAVACGGATGDDVHVGDGQSASQKQGETCAIAAGEDVCTRFASTVSPDALATIASAVAFAGLAERSLKAMEAACIGLGADLGAPIPTFPASSTLGARTKAACEVAAAAIDARKTSGTAFSVRFDPDQNCHALAPPVCASTTNTMDECSPKHLQIALGPNPTPQEQAFASALEARLPAILAYKDVLARLVDFAGRFSGNVEHVTELPDACVGAVSHLVSEAISEVTAASEATATVAGKL